MEGGRAVSVHRSDGAAKRVASVTQFGQSIEGDGRTITAIPGQRC